MMQQLRQKAREKMQLVCDLFEKTMDNMTVLYVLELLNLPYKQTVAIYSVVGSFFFIFLNVLFILLFVVSFILKVFKMC